MQYKQPVIYILSHLLFIYNNVHNVHYSITAFFTYFTMLGLLYIQGVCNLTLNLMHFTQ